MITTRPIGLPIGEITLATWWPGLDFPLEEVATGATLSADQGTFTLSGQAASLLASRVLSAEHGTFALTGQGATLTRTYVLPLTYSAFVLTGQGALLRVGAAPVPHPYPLRVQLLPQELRVQLLPLPDTRVLLEAA